jgi:hypothetical protein
MVGRIHLFPKSPVVSQKGQFLVKSAYHVLVDNRELLKRKQKGESSTTAN